MRVWLDDLRPMPDAYDVHLKTAEEAIQLLVTGYVTAISLDHDLGDDVGTGYDVAAWIEEAAFDGRLQRLEIDIHSANPVGRNRTEAAIRNAFRFWAAKSNSSPSPFAATACSWVF